MATPCDVCKEYRKIIEEKDKTIEEQAELIETYQKNIVATRKRSRSFDDDDFVENAILWDIENQDDILVKIFKKPGSVWKSPFKPYDGKVQYLITKQRFYEEYKQRMADEVLVHVSHSNWERLLKGSRDIHPPDELFPAHCIGNVYRALIYNITRYIYFSNNGRISDKLGFQSSILSLVSNVLAFYSRNMPKDKKEIKKFANLSPNSGGGQGKEGDEGYIFCYVIAKNKLEKFIERLEVVEKKTKEDKQAQEQ